MNDSLSPIALLEKMLRYCISEAWENPRGLPYTPHSLRRDVPLQRGLEEASERLERSPVTDLSYRKIEKIYRSNLENVHRALDTARRSDPDYVDLDATLERIRPDFNIDDWNEWLAVLQEHLYSTTSFSSAEIGSVLDNVRSHISSSWNSSPKVEENYGDILSMHLHILYALSSNGINPDSENLRYPDSPHQILSSYFEGVVSDKLASFFKADAPRTSRSRSLEVADNEKAFLHILATSQTDWDSVYRSLRPLRTSHR